MDKVRVFKLVYLFENMVRGGGFCFSSLELGRGLDMRVGYFCKLGLGIG